MPEGRRALSEMFIDLCLAFHATTVPANQQPPETDANQALVAVTVMLGHANGHPFNVSQIAKRVRMPRTSVLRRLEALVDSGLIKRIDGKYYLEPGRAKCVPHRDRFELILSKAIAVLAPILSEMDI